MSKDSNDNLSLTRRTVIASGTLAAASVSATSAFAAPSDAEFVLVRKPAKSATGKIVAPVLRSRLYVRSASDENYGHAICDFIEAPAADSTPFVSRLNPSTHKVRSIDTSLRSLIGLSSDNWEFHLSDGIATPAIASISPNTNNTQSGLKISLPLEGSADHISSHYTLQKSPKDALKELKRIMTSVPQGAPLKVVDDTNLFADFEIDIPKAADVEMVQA